MGKRLLRRLRGIHEMELPDDQWLKTYRVYGSIASALLSEQRERFKLLAAGEGDTPDIPDAQAAKELDEIAVRRLLAKLPKGARKQIIDIIENGPKETLGLGIEYDIGDGEDPGDGT